MAHLSPDAPLVDVYVNGVKALSGVAYKDVSGYLPIPAGSVNFKVTPANAATPVVIDATVNLNSGGNYTVAATGLLASIQPLVLEDDRGTTGQAKVRFVHTSPDAPAVDVAVKGGPVLFSNVSFRQFSGYPQVAPGTYDLEVRVAGTTTVALAVPGVALRSGTNYSIFAVGLLSNRSLGRCRRSTRRRAVGAGRLRGKARPVGRAFRRFRGSRWPAQAAVLYAGSDTS